MTSFETFDPGVVRCGNTVLQSGTQSHTGVIFPLVRISSPRENMSILIISTKTFSHPQTKGHAASFLLDCTLLQISCQIGANFLGSFFGQSMFFRPNMLLCCAGLNIKYQAAPSHVNLPPMVCPTPSSISNKPSVTQAHRRPLIVCLPIIYQPPPPAFACLVSFYCPSV